MAELGRRLKVVDRERVDVETFEVRTPVRARSLSA